MSDNAAVKIVPDTVVRLSPRVLRVTAPNPGMMTGPGTNSYIVGENEVAVIDPGPESAVHTQTLLDAVAATGGRLRWILCTHTHQDHSPGARALKAATAATVLGMAAPAQPNQDSAFAPDRVLRDGEKISASGYTLRAVHTPGHASNHLCYLLEEEQLLFTGDHVMQGSTVVITPPDGDMSAYLKSLTLLKDIDLARIAPGHGHVIETPHTEVDRVIAHRLKREQKVVATLAALNAKNADGHATIDQLLPLVYDDTPQFLHVAARRSLYAHLLKLADDGRVQLQNDQWRLVVSGAA